jgi:hypothetical protein
MLKSWLFASDSGGNPHRCVLDASSPLQNQSHKHAGSGLFKRFRSESHASARFPTVTFCTEKQGDPDVLRTAMNEGDGARGAARRDALLQLPLDLDGDERCSPHIGVARCVRWTGPGRHVTRKSQQEAPAARRTMKQAVKHAAETDLATPDQSARLVES